MNGFFSYNLSTCFNKAQVIMTEQATSLPIRKRSTDDTQATSLSIKETLISDTKALAEELDMPWSGLVTLALEEFVRRHRGKKSLTDRIDAAYAGPPDEEEAEILRRMSTGYRKIVEGEW